MAFELLYMFQVIEYMLSIGIMEWDMVLKVHLMNYSRQDVDSLKRKCMSTYQKKIPTCDPSMPDEVRLSKQVKYFIGNKAKSGDDTG